MTKKFLNRFIVIILFMISLMTTAQKIKVACIGDSVTFGAGIKDRKENSYPAQLQKLLGDNYQVKNFGFSGATLLKNGHKPYWTKKVFQKSKDYAPDVAIIHLGLNDQGNNNWPKYKQEFVTDYLNLISVYKSLPSKPKIYICRMSPTFSGHHWFEEGMRENFKEIQAKIEKIAIKANVKLIDLHGPLYRFPEYFPDNLHPKKEGAKIMSEKIHSSITGNFGGLQLPLLFGENMVLQRNEPILINGTSNSNDQITVKLHNETAKTTVANNGKWKVTLPAMKAGGPYKLSVTSKLSNDIRISKVYIGEVWLASGQSNMDFKIKRIKHASSVLKDSLNPNIFLFSLDPKVLKSGKFTNEELELCNAKNYFKASGWSNKKGEILENFSAVAYAYAYNLQKKLNVPVGVICNAIGGSPIQAWISREGMESQHYTIDLLNDTWGNPMTHPWVSKRKFENFSKFKRTPVLSRHPYDPTFLFDSGISPIKHYNIKGVIWYQGESNAQQITLHSKLFKMLVNDWRLQWKKPNMPFYYTQLSSINRSTWGAFRNSQRKLLSISNTGMAITLDVGHKTDVHPKQKWIVGRRLSKIALAKTYYKNIPYSGPSFDFVNIAGNKLEVHFNFSEGLKTSDNTSIKDIQIADSDKLFVPAQTKIKNDKLIVWSKEIKNPRYVRYGFTPFTNGNLVNKFGLPTATFSNETEVNLNISQNKRYSTHYYNRKSLFDTALDTKDEIIFLGNSITEGGNWKALFPNKNVINRGISGDVTDGISNRIDEITSSKPKKVFLLVGTNDLARGKNVDYVLNGTRKIIEQIINKSENTTIYLQSILPVNPYVGEKFSGHKSNHQKIIRANAKLKELARIYNLIFIDLHKSMRNKEKHLKAKYTYDGLHLSEKGYQKWKRIIKSHVN